jgi:hypothetical protein
VREAAGGLLGTLLDRDFTKIRGRLEVLRSSRSENLRRSVVLAVKYAARRDKPERVPQLLALLQPLMRDEEPYVRRNLGPSAIGDGLLRAEPLVRNAVAKAMRRSRQRYTDEVEETRLRWLKDRDRAATAELVGPLKRR